MKKTYIAPSQEVINMSPEALMLGLSNTEVSSTQQLSNDKVWNNKSIWDNE